jgi:hypothetical protein
MALVDITHGKQRHVPYRDSKLTFLLRVSKTDAFQNFNTVTGAEFLYTPKEKLANSVPTLEQV